jgi:hypothetical protein
MLLMVASVLSFVPVTFTVNDAQARIGRPFTPFSVAGMHRRHVRRAFVAGAALGSPWYPGAHSGCTCYPSGAWGAPGVGGWGSGFGYRPGFGFGAPGFGWHRGWW